MSETLVGSLKKEAKKVAVEEELKWQNGTHVILTKRETSTGESDFMRIAFEEQYTGTINGVSGTYIGVTFKPNAHSDVVGNFTFSKPTLKLITPKEGKKIEERMAKDAEEKAKVAKERLKTIFSEKRVKILDRVLAETTTKDFLETNANFIKLYSSCDKEGNPVGTGSNYWEAVCCSLTKTTSNIEVYIPKDWLTYYGYSLVDLKIWLSFLRKCDIGFEGKYTGETTLVEAFGASSGTARYPRFDKNNRYITPDMVCYKVFIKSTQSTMRNYMNFLLVRYMYNMQYWNIPTVAIQLKRSIGEDITFWEALLAAHMYQQYYGYYALMSNTNNSTALPIDANSPKNICSKLATGNYNMNGSFTMKSYDSSIIKKYLQKKDYDSIMKEVLKWRNIK